MSEMEVPEGWELKTIEEICTKITDGEHLKPKIVSEGIPFVSAKDLKDDGVDFNHVLYVDKADAEIFRKKCNPEKNDILIGSRGSIGRICLVNTEKIFCLLGSVILLKPISSIQSKFISYFFKSPQIQNQLLNASGHSVVKALYLRDIKKLKIPVPERIETQKKIVAKLDHIFSQLEEKKKEILSRIEKNKERIDFFDKNWFAYLIDNEIEKHPNRKEWKIHQLQEITNTIGDGIHKTPNYSDNSDFYFINGNNLRNGSIVITQNTKMVDKDEFQKYKIDLNIRTLLLSINGTIGNLSYYRNEKVILGKSACYINCNDDLEPDFLFYLLQSNQIKKYFNAELTQTSIPNLSLKSVRRTPIPLPPVSIQQQIVKNIKNIEDKLKNQKSEFENIQNQHELIKKHLNSLSSSILNDAFSGKLVN